MFCPNCGKSEQTINTYCRSCGEFLPDFTKSYKKQHTPEDQFKMSLTFNVMSAMAALSMAIMLYVFHLGNPNTHPSVYVAASLLIAISAWQIVSYFNNRKLKQRFVREKVETEIHTKEFEMPEKNQHLPEADFTNDVPASVVENTTKKLKVNSSTQTEH